MGVHGVGVVTSGPSLFPGGDDAARPGPRLRPLRAEDAPQVLEAFASDPDMVRQGTVRTLADAEHYVLRVSDPASGAAWALCDGSLLVGLIGITIDEKNKSGWFWYWMTSRSRGRGWTARAAATVADWALSERGLQRLELGHRVNNPASGAVARSAGFVKEGTERGKFWIDGIRVDVDTYGRLASDPWPAYSAVPFAETSAESKTAPEPGLHS